MAPYVRELLLHQLKNARDKLRCRIAELKEACANVRRVVSSLRDTRALVHFLEDSLLRSGEDVSAADLIPNGVDHDGIPF